MFEGSEAYRIWVPGVSVCLPLLAPNCLGQKHMSYLGLFPVLPPGPPGVGGTPSGGGGGMEKDFGLGRSQWEEL